MATLINYTCKSFIEFIPGKSEKQEQVDNGLFVSLHDTERTGCAFFGGARKAMLCA